MFGRAQPGSSVTLDGSAVMVTRDGHFVIGFDRADVHWLRGYCHFLAALGELCLAVDGQQCFECSAHLFFEKVETPHTFLLQARRAFDENPLNNRETISDAISFFHQLTRLPIKEPARIDETILDVARRAGAPIGNSCGGVGVCARCVVRIVAGAENLTPATAIETRIGAQRGVSAGERFACQAVVTGDCEVTTTYW